MADKRAIKVSTLDELAEGFQKSRGITDKLTIKQMIAFAKEPVGGGENKLPALFSNTLTELTAEDFEGITKIKNHACHFLTSLTSLILSDTIEIIGEYAFIGTNITNLIIPNSTRFIGYDCFEYCENLITVILPDSLTTLQNNSFKDCTSLTSVSLGSGLTELSLSVFANCTALKDITIPANITSIKGSALQIGNTGEGQKATITFLSSTPPSIATSTFKAAKLEKIIVPAGSGEAYKTATNWANFADYIEEAAV